MSLEDIVDLTITVASSTLARPSFGTPIGLVSKVPAGWGSDLVKEFSKVSELTDLGFTSSDPAYKLAQKIKSQNPAPKKFKLAKRTAPAQSLQLKCLSATQGDVYNVKVAVGAGAFTQVTYTVLAAATTTTVAAAIELLIEAVTGVNSSPTTDTITVTPATPGDLVNLKDWSSNFEVTDATAAPGADDDLDDVLAVDTAWYGVLLDSNSAAEVGEVAAWVEANKKLFAYTTSDAAVAKSGSTTDVAYVSKAAAYTRTFGLYQKHELLSYAAAAWMGRGLAYDPGRITWAYKDLAGIEVDVLTTGERSALEAKNCNYYENVGGKNVTLNGKLASGEFIDVTHFVDWLDAEMRIQVFAAISSLPKLPYTNSGLATIEATVKAVLQAGVRVGGLIDNENLFVRMPSLDDIDAITRAQRLVPDIEFGAELAGAIHKAKLAGTLTNG